MHPRKLVPLLIPLLCGMAGLVAASSHMDAPLITLDDAANTTDVYAFVSGTPEQKFLTLALGVYPFEEPGIGPNKFNFDEKVLYELHVALGNDLAAGRATISYQFRFETRYKNQATILQSYLGVIQDVDDANQNLTQTYTVKKVDRRGRGRSTTLGTGIVPPNNQGIATPEYNTNAGEGPARDGVASAAQLDRYTAQTIFTLRDGYRVFCGQREDGFYADIQAIFDLLRLRGAGQARDSQGGFNIHMIAIQVPVAELGGDLQVAGVYATTSRPRVTLRSSGGPAYSSPFVQVGRQGNPLFCEGLVAIQDKDLYNRTKPTRDAALFRRYAETPELASLLNLLVLMPPIPGIETQRTDISAIFIPDLIKVDLSTDRARFAGGGPSHPTNPDDPGFSRLSIFGGDVLPSPLSGGNVAGGWPNGRRFGDDVVDIAVTALISDLRVNPPIIRGPAGDNVDRNDAVYNKVFPYAATPMNGRNHPHH